METKSSSFFPQLGLSWLLDQFRPISFNSPHNLFFRYVFSTDGLGAQEAPVLSFKLSLPAMGDAAKRVGRAVCPPKISYLSPLACIPAWGTSLQITPFHKRSYSLIESSRLLEVREMAGLRYCNQGCLGNTFSHVF